MYLNIEISDELRDELKMEAISEKKLLKDYVNDILKNRKKRGTNK